MVTCRSPSEPREVRRKRFHPGARQIPAAPAKNSMSAARTAPIHERRADPFRPQALCVPHDAAGLFPTFPFMRIKWKRRRATRASHSIQRRKRPNVSQNASRPKCGPEACVQCVRSKCIRFYATGLDVHARISSSREKSVNPIALTSFCPWLLSVAKKLTVPESRSLQVSTGYGLTLSKTAEGPRTRCRNAWRFQESAGSETPRERISRCTNQKRASAWIAGRRFFDRFRSKCKGAR